MLFFLIFIFFGFSAACRLDPSLHGYYKRQSSSLGKLVFDNAVRESVVFDDLTITATAISEYGECYEKSADAYIFALKRMGRAPCFRCITPIVKTPNIVQLAHQQEDVCYETAEEAKTTCFDSNLVSPSDGYLAFRSENVDPAICGVSGRFSVGYQLRGGDLNCSVGARSTATSCEDSSLFSVQFKNCSFPDFEMSLRCIGSWKERDGRQLAVFLNEENGEYRCGTFEEQPPEGGKLHLANDSSCGRLSPINAFETYTLKSEFFDSGPTACSFPEWLRGNYDSLTITADILRYEGAGAAPVLSRCVHVDGERIIVHSRTKCGEELGFHCLWFRARSDNLIEFKTTTPSEKSEDGVCSESGELAAAPWTSALVLEPKPVGCGIKGQYTTPEELRKTDCFNVSVDCVRSDSLRLAAYDCKTGLVFDSRTYGCAASWKDADQLFIYSTRARDNHSCFVLRYEGGRLFFASTGAHCSRGFNFTENSDKTIILEENGGCVAPTTTAPPTVPPPPKPKPARRPSYQVYRRPTVPMVISTSTTAVDITNREFLTDSSVGNLLNSCGYLLLLLLGLL